VRAGNRDALHGGGLDVQRVRGHLTICANAVTSAVMVNASAGLLLGAPRQRPLVKLYPAPPEVADAGAVKFNRGSATKQRAGVVGGSAGDPVIATPGRLTARHCERLRAGRRWCGHGIGSGPRLSVIVT